MVLMTITFDPKQTENAADLNDYSKAQLLLSNMGVAAQKLSLIGYQVIMNKPTATAAAAVVLPSRLYVELDFVGGTQLHVASSPNPNDTTQYEHIHALPLVLGSLNTINMGMGGIEFNISQRINKHIKINVKRLDDDSTSNTYGKLIPVKTDSPTYLQTQVAAGSIPASTTTLHSITLYFDYPFVSLF